MNILTELSDSTIKCICEYCNGDYNNSVLNRRTGSEIVDYLSHKFKTPGLIAGPSRWSLVYDTLEYLDGLDKLDYFFNVMFSIRNIRKDNTDKNEDECALLQDKAINTINAWLLQDDYELVKVPGKIILRKIDSNLEPIGKGGFAEVYKIIGENIVVKKLKDEYKSDRSIVSRFKREFQITNDTLDGINGVIKVYDYNKTDISYTMEYCETDLNAYLNKYTLNALDRTKLILEILTTMSKVHDVDVIHRDLSPKNIFIKSGMPIIADFGLGKDLNALRSHQTYDTSYQGTLEYCDPRQLRELAEGDKLSDIYSLGRIINFIMTKDPNNYNHDYMIPATIATNEDADKRYQSIQEFIKDIKDTIKAKHSDEYAEECKEMISQGRYDEKMDSYLFEFKGLDLVYKMDNEGFRRIYKNLFKEPKNYELLEKILDGAFDEMRSNYLQFKGLDGFGYLMVDVLCGKNIPVKMKITAGDVLNIIIGDINRFNVTRYFNSKHDKGLIDSAYVRKLLVE